MTWNEKLAPAIVVSVLATQLDWESWEHGNDLMRLLWHRTPGSRQPDVYCRIEDSGKADYLCMADDGLIGLISHKRGTMHRPCQILLLHIIDPSIDSDQRV